MIVKFARDGTSAKGLVQYLMHDAGHATTSERVAWAHTFNLANDGQEIPSAVHEMVTTYLSSDLLRAEAGLTGSRPDKTMKHVSLNWHPSEVVSKAEMIHAAADFLKAMGWSKFQSIVVCHLDKQPHVHIAISKIHPVTGKALDEGFCHRRAQRWALGYEQGRGKVWCQQRLSPAEQREASPTRPVWELLEKGWQAFQRAETARIVEAPEADSERRLAERYEWQIVRELQKESRVAFFENGRTAYKRLRSEVYREVRKEFRHDWAALYQAERDGVSQGDLAAMKADLVARQKHALEFSRDRELNTLRAERDGIYRELLLQQREERAALLGHQERGQSSFNRLRDMAETPPTRLAAAPNAIESANATQRIRQNETERANRLRWQVNGGGMVAQQTAAMRWLQAAARGADIQPKQEVDKTMTPAKAWLYGVKRSAAAGGKERHTDRPERGAGIEPD